MAEKTRRSLIKGANWILSGILSLLGFSGCEDDSETPAEYGTPYATFSFQGTVADKAGNPVQDIKIEVKGSTGSALTITNEAGHYFTKFTEFPTAEFQMIVSDIDGEANGSFRNDTIPVVIGKDDYYEAGSGNWNAGSAHKEVNVTLKEKE
jgi:putative lipoprotein (rSAM/lipoprotein system)